MGGNFQLYMNLGLVAITAVVFVVMVTKTKAKEDSEFAKKQQQKVIRRYQFWFDNFLFRGTFRRTAELYNSLQCFDEKVAKVREILTTQFDAE